MSKLAIFTVCYSSVCGGSSPHVHFPYLDTFRLELKDLPGIRSERKHLKKILNPAVLSVVFGLYVLSLC